MVSTFRAVIFDLDGVLIDSRAMIESRWRAWADEHNIPFERVKSVYHGRPSVEVIREVAPHLDAEFEAEKRRTESARDLDQLALFRGAASLVQTVPDGQWTIATSGTYETASARLETVGLREPKTLVTADDVERGKPAPDPYELAAQRLDAPPNRCVVFEDAPVGVESAQRAGAYAIGVAATTTSGALRSADSVVSSLEDVTVRPTGNGDLAGEVVTRRRRSGSRFPAARIVNLIRTFSGRNGNRIRATIGPGHLYLLRCAGDAEDLRGTTLRPVSGTGVNGAARTLRSVFINDPGARANSELILLWPFEVHLDPGVG